MEHLKGLNEAQKEAVLHLDGPLLIVAGAGAGKTKTITHRIVHLISSGVSAERILAVTFTNKAAGEMRERVHGLLSAAGLQGRPPESAWPHAGWPLIATFHSLGVRLLREFAIHIGIPRAFAIWDRDDSVKMIKRILAGQGLENRFPPRQVLGRISREKGEGRTADEMYESANSSYDASVAQVWKAYEAARVQEGALDFDDLLVQTLSLLKKDSAILARLQKRWSHITIDEYQDTNQIQYEIMRLIAGAPMNICVVGDIDQCIYTWRQAKMENLLSFEKTFPGTKAVLLEQNYRSTQTIITAANAVIEKNVNRIPKKLFTSNPTGEAIELFAGETERDEAFFVARSARELLGSGVKASEIAVLFRENFQSRALEEAFIAEGVPYRVLGTRFFERAEVKDVLSYLRAARNPKSSVDFARAASSPPRGIGKTTLDKLLSGSGALSSATHAKVASFRALLLQIAQAIETHKASDAVHFAIKASGLEKALAESKDEVDRLQNVFELAAHALRYDALPAPEGIERLLEDAALMTDQDELEDKKEAVSLMTVHASKGLEFDTIFVTGLEHGLFPSERESDDSRDPEEERRLFYVALTRAKKHLFLTLAASRLRYGQRERTIPSTFLEDIDQRLIKYADEPRVFEPVIE